VTEHSSLPEVLSRSGPVQLGSGPDYKLPSLVWKQSILEVSLPAKLEDRLKSSLGISQLVILVFLIKKDMSSLELTEMKQQ